MRPGWARGSGRTQLAITKSPVFQPCGAPRFSWSSALDMQGQHGMSVKAPRVVFFQRAVQARNATGADWPSIQITAAPPSETLARPTVRVRCGSAPRYGRYSISAGAG